MVIRHTLLSLNKHFQGWLSQVAPPSNQTQSASQAVSPSLASPLQGMFTHPERPQISGKPPSEDTEIRLSIQAGTLQHIAIIMDGNRRWAKQRNLPMALGHAEGVKALKRVVHYACHIGLPHLTLYAFSTENWHRDTLEVQVLMKLLEASLQEELAELQALGVKLHFIGRRHRLPASLQAILLSCEEATRHNTQLNLIVALDYGSRDELGLAVQALLEEVHQHPERYEALQHALSHDPQTTLHAYLHTRGFPDPDLMIRPGGETRLSNFMLWQLAYAELHFVPWLWPDIEATHIRQACETFLKKSRRYGK